MKRITIILIALAITAAALTTAAAADAPEDQWRDVDVEELTKKIPGEEDYPDADAIFAKVQEFIQIADDGSSEARRNLLVRILSLMGRETYSNQIFTNDSDVRTISVTKAQTVRKTGRVVEVEEDAINDVTPAFLEGASMYANVLDKVISFPVAGPGSTIELQLTETREATKDGSFSGVEYFGGDDPYLDHELTLLYPADVEVRAAELGGIAELGELRRKNGRGKITWSAEDVGALPPEGNAPPRSELLPRIMYSSYQDWDEAAAFFAGEFFPHVQSDGAVAEHAAQVTAEYTEQDHKTYSFFIDVATGIRNIYLNLGLGGYEPNDASLVLENKYGDTRDKAVLLVSGLRSLGVDAYPALVRGQRTTFVESVPTLKQFDRMLVAVPGEEGYTFFDPMLDDVALGYLRWGRGNTALVVKDDGSGELVGIPAFEPEENVSRHTVSMGFRPDGPTEASVSCELTGRFDRRARRELKDATPSEAEDFFEATANAFSPGGESLHTSVSDLKRLNGPCRIQQVVSVTDFAVKQGDFMIVRVPEFPFEFARIDFYPSLAERELPFDTPCELVSEYWCKIVLPVGYDAVRIPEAVAVDTPVARFELRCDYDRDARTIHWKETITLREKTIPIESYAEFKDAYDTLVSPKSRLVLLQTEELLRKEQF